MSELDATLNVRMTSEKRARIDRAAAEDGMTRSEWANKVLDDALRLRTKPPDGRRVTVFRERVMMPGSMAPAVCNHPPQVRSEPGPDGTTRCLACNSTFRKLP